MLLKTSTPSSIIIFKGDILKKQESQKRVFFTPEKMVNKERFIR